MRTANNLTTFMCRLSWNLGASNSWNPQGVSKPVIEFLYFYLYLYHKYTQLKSVLPIEWLMSFQKKFIARLYIWLPWCFSDRASWIDYILITNVKHWLLFIHKILFSSTSFEAQVLIFRRLQLCTCSIWYCHSLRDYVVACRDTVWVLTQAV